MPEPLFVLFLIMISLSFFKNHQQNPFLKAVHSVFTYKLQPKTIHLLSKQFLLVHLSLPLPGSFSHLNNLIFYCFAVGTSWVYFFGLVFLFHLSLLTAIFWSFSQERNLRHVLNYTNWSVQGAAEMGRAWRGSL